MADTKQELHFDVLLQNSLRSLISGHNSMPLLSQIMQAINLGDDSYEFLSDTINATFGEGASEYLDKMDDSEFLKYLTFDKDIIYIDEINSHGDDLWFFVPCTYDMDSFTKDHEQKIQEFLEDMQR